MNALSFRLVTLGLMAFTAGCATAPTQQQLSAADYGAYPTNYESIVKNFYAGALKDPDSAQYRLITPPQKYWVRAPLGGAVRYGYLVCATVNAKNSFGGYIGFQTQGLLIRESAVVHLFEFDCPNQPPIS